MSARSVNAVMTSMYREIGRRIVESEIRGENRGLRGATGGTIRQISNATIRARLREATSGGCWDFHRAWPDQDISPDSVWKICTSIALRPRPTTSERFRPRRSFPAASVCVCAASISQNREARKFHESEALRAAYLPPHLPFRSGRHWRAGRVQQKLTRNAPV